MTREQMLCHIDGVGPDAPVSVNEKGGKQSSSPYRADLLPALATLEVAKVLKHGAAKYGPDNWRNLTTEEILNHVQVHLLAWFAGDRSDDHLSHAACRCLMALDLELCRERELREYSAVEDEQDETEYAVTNPQTDVMW